MARGNGNSFCQPLRAPCPFNARKMKDGACITCEKNEYVDVRKNTCAKCTDGLVSMGGGVTKCEKCSTGMVKLEFVTKGKVCDCDVGTVLQRGKCVKCPSGSSRKPGDVGGCKKCAKGSFERDGKCVECAVDTYQPAEGAKSCLPCVGNQVVGSTVDTPAHELQGASRCVRCKKGWYFSDREYPGSCVSGRTNCADGYTRRMIREGNREEFGGCRRNVCPKGTFREGEFGACISCDRGTYYNKKERRCDFCERDEVSEGGLVEKCTKCTGGLVPDAADGGSCTCQATFEDRGNPFEPTKIARGYNKSGVCELCAKGTFNEDDSNRCSPCPMGTFADRRGMDKCKTCPPNTFSRGGASKCETCAKGSVTYGFGDPKCLILS